jgi:hypothetical protein
VHKSTEQSRVPGRFGSAQVFIALAGLVSQHALLFQQRQPRLRAPGVIPARALCPVPFGLFLLSRGVGRHQCSPIADDATVFALVRRSCQGGTRLGPLQARRDPQSIPRVRRGDTTEIGR